MSHRYRITSPWWFTDKILRKYLKASTSYLTGSLLDIGCGGQPYKNMFKCNEYVGMDMSNRFNPDIVGDVRRMQAVASANFDSILCSQLLEHVDDVDSALAEMYRVLKPGGYVCVTVPFISRLHGMPHDYWRWSASGLRHLFEKHHFEVALVEPMGGFLTTQCFLWAFYIHERSEKYLVTRYLCRVLMMFLNPLFWLLHQLDRDKTTPFNYLAIAGRRAEQEGQANREPTGGQCD